MEGLGVLWFLISIPTGLWGLAIVWSKGGLRPWRWNYTPWTYADLIVYGWLLCLIYFLGVLPLLVVTAGPLLLLWAKMTGSREPLSSWEVQRRLDELDRMPPPPPSVFYGDRD